MTIDYSTLYNLPEISFIEGSDKILTFTVYEQDGITLQDINGSLIKWYLFPYGDSSYVLIEKDGELTTENEFAVSISRDDYVGLSGKFTQQLLITDFEGSPFRPAQGIVIVLPGTYE